MGDYDFDFTPILVDGIVGGGIVSIVLWELAKYLLSHIHIVWGQ